MELQLRTAILAITVMQEPRDQTLKLALLANITHKAQQVVLVSHVLPEVTVTKLNKLPANQVSIVIIQLRLTL